MGDEDAGQICLGGGGGLSSPARRRAGDWLRCLTVTQCSLYSGCWCEKWCEAGCNLMNRNRHGGVFTRRRRLVRLSTVDDRLYSGQSVLAVRQIFHTFAF